MGKPFKINVQGLGNLTKNLQTLPAKLQKEVSGEIEATARDINAKQVRNTPVDEGGNRQTIGYKKVSPLEFEIFSSKAYAPFMEFGTKSKVIVPAELASYASQFKQSGPNIGFEEFLKIIAAWVKRKGIAGRFSVKTRKRIGGKTTQEKEDLQAAYPIALSILKKGVNPHPFFFDPYIQERKVLIDRIRKIIEQI